MNKYTKNSSNGCVLEVGLEYPKELYELHNDYPLASDKIEINIKRLSRYHLKLKIFIMFLLAMLKGWCWTYYVRYYENW